MTRLLHAGSAAGLWQLVAALDAGQLGAVDEPQVLVVSRSGPVPELLPAPSLAGGVTAVRDRVSAIVDWNALIAPLHPAAWLPSPAEEPLLARLIARELGLDEAPTELITTGLDSGPGRALALLLPDCPITALVDDLTGYGPSRNHLREDVGERLQRRVHLDLVPGVEPLALREWGAPTVRLDPAALRDVVASLPAPPAAGAAAGLPVVLGQALAARGLLAAGQEARLHADALRGLAARGHRRVVWRGHPDAPSAGLAELHGHAATLGIELVVPDDDLPAEAWFVAARPELVVSTCSTALFTAQTFGGSEVATVGTELLLDALVPYENPARMPATIADAVLPVLGSDGALAAPTADEVAPLVRAVGYCMRATRLEDLRDDTLAFLDGGTPGDPRVTRWFKRRRLESLALTPPRPAAPRSTPEPAPVPASRRLARAAGRRLRTAVHEHRDRSV